MVQKGQSITGVTEVLVDITRHPTKEMLVMCVLNWALEMTLLFYRVNSSVHCTEKGLIYL